MHRRIHDLKYHSQMQNSFLTASSLANEYSIAAAERESYQRDGHILLRGVAAPSEIAPLRAVLQGIAEEHRRKQAALEERDTYRKAFLQINGVWKRDEAVHRWTFARRFAGIAAALMGVPSVRLYSDQALFKEPGGGHTPWHQDQVYWPLASPQTITMWMPLVDASAEMGTMTFASGSHRDGAMSELVISDESQVEFNRLIEERALPLCNAGAMQAGDATWHAGWTLHGAPGNTTEAMREVMTIIYFADGVCLMDEITPSSQGDKDGFFPDAQPGELATGELHPILYP